MSKPGTEVGHLNWETGEWIVDGVRGKNGRTLVSPHNCKIDPASNRCSICGRKP